MSRDLERDKSFRLIKIFGNGKTKNGFTLIELLVALAILVLAAAALVPLVSFTAQATSMNRIQLNGKNIAYADIEKIKAMKYEDIGTVGGDPSGSLLPTEVQTFDGRDYTIIRNIEFEEATNKIVSAYKRIQIVVTVQGAFNNAISKVADVDTVITTESEPEFYNAGNIKVTINKGDSLSLFKTKSFEVEAGSSSKITTKLTGAVGSVIFGMMPVDSYYVKVKIPDDLICRPDEILDANRWIQKTNVQVNATSTNLVSFFVDTPRQIKLLFKDGMNNIVKPSGDLTLTWKTLDGDPIPKEMQIFKKHFSSNDLDADGYLNQGFFGSVWPGGKYSIKIENIEGFNNFDSNNGNRILKVNNTNWNGTFTESDSIMQLTAYLPKAFYIEDSQLDFQGDEKTSVLTEAMATLNGALELNQHGTEIYRDFVGFRASDITSGHDARYAFDNSLSTSWEEDKNGDQWVECKLKDKIKISKVEINSGSSYKLNFIIRGSNDGGSWSNIITGTMREGSNSYDCSSNNIEYQYYRLLCTESYTYRIKELAFTRKAHRPENGKRISKPIDLSQYSYAPLFRMDWLANIPANTSLTMKVAITNSNTNIPSDSEFKIVPNSGSLILPLFAGAVNEGDNLVGKYMWIKEELSTSNPNDVNVTPSLQWVQVTY